MKILVDMNLSPLWVRVLGEAGLEAVHWSEIGDPRAPDRLIMEWARNSGAIILTKDLDFGALLAMTAAKGPSVVQIRGFRLAPRHIGDLIVRTLKQNVAALRAGALIVLYESAARVRILPLSPNPSNPAH